MTLIRKARAGGLLALTPVLVLALAGCAATKSQTAASPSPLPRGTAPATSPARSPAATPAPAPSAATAGAAGTVLSSRVTYPWHWPNDVARPASVPHAYPVPPVAELIAISAASHPAEPGQRRYDRMSFTFATAFPGYQAAFVSALVKDPSGQPIALPGQGVLKVTFHEAQAHTASGGTSIVSQPPAGLGMTRMAGWAPAGDFEGVLSYGIGVTWPIPQSNPQIAVRVTEVEKVTSRGQHLYVVAIDVDATPVGAPGQSP